MRFEWLIPGILHCTRSFGNSNTTTARAKYLERISAFSCPAQFALQLFPFFIFWCFLFHSLISLFLPPQYLCKSEGNQPNERAIRFCAWFFLPCGALIFAIEIVRFPFFLFLPYAFIVSACKSGGNVQPDGREAKPFFRWFSSSPLAKIREASSFL